MGLRRTSIGVVICFLWMAQADAQERREFIPSPFGSLARTRLLLDGADVKVMLGLGYVLLKGVAARLAERQGVSEVRVYRRMAVDSSAVDSSAAGKQREYRVEIGIVSNPLTSKGYEFAIYSEMPGQDFKQVVDSLKVFAGQVGEKAPAYTLDQVGFESHSLSHIEADQALALLGALGYWTVQSIKSTQQAGGATSPGGYPPSPHPGGSPLQQMGGLTSHILNALAEKKLPIVVNIQRATQTSLKKDQPADQGQPGSGKWQTISGRSLLNETTAGEPQQRLMIIYDKDDTEGRQKLLNLLDDQIDVPAEQIVIEALILEVNVSRLRDLGVEFQGQRRHERGTFERSESGGDVPFSLFFSRKTFENAGQFEATLETLIDKGEAEVLSSPSVLVLNDRQARIRIGQYIPITQAVLTTTGVSTNVNLEPTGITLNLRPRIIEREKEIAMQVEIVVSAANQKTFVYQAAGGQLVLAPTVDSREVESFVRVADNTPFIIGGLISTDRRARQVGIPLVGQVPLLGRLFKREHVERVQREVIVVITPHIVPQKEKTFGYLIPKDSPAFDRFDTRLFRNAYRVRDDDILDFKFVRESRVLNEVAAQLKGKIPGEEILVQRMLYEIVSKPKIKYGEEVDVNGIHFFEANPQQGADRFRDRRLKEALDDSIRGRDNRVLLLSYDNVEQAPSDTAVIYGLPDSLRLFNPPIASVTLRRVHPDSQSALLKRENTLKKTAILFAGPSDVDHLRRVLVVKRLLELNFSGEGGLPRTLQAFRPGLQLLFPSQEEMRTRGHLIDLEVARLFYQTRFYYSVFEWEFNKGVQDYLQKVRYKRPIQERRDSTGQVH